MSKLLIKIYRWIFARPELLQFNEALLRMVLRSLGIQNHEDISVSGELHFVSAILPDLINTSTPIMFDVGANIGEFSDALVDTFPHATIYAFEPHPNTYQKLVKKTGIDNVHLNQLALGESSGKVTLYDRADMDGSEHASLHEEVISDIHRKQVTANSVSMETLDNFCHKHGIEAIDLLKIDTEGNELSVLHGAKRLLGNGCIHCILFEFNEMNVISRTFFRDFRLLLPEFDFYRLLPHGLIYLSNETNPVLTELFAFQNIIAVPKGTEMRY